MRSHVKIVALILMLLILPSAALALTIESCSSNTESWKCEKGKLCICRISGSCTNGNLLVYKTSLANLLCAPSIVDGTAEIDWNFCGNPTGTVRVIADCDEGQSEERSLEIIILAPTTTTSTTTTIPLTPTTTSTTTSTTPPFRPTTTIPTTAKEECPYECCVDEPQFYDKHCGAGFRCVDNVCEPIPSEETKRGGGGGALIILVLLLFVILIGAIVVFFKLKRTAPKSYEDLYKKWGRRSRTF